jgi:Na+-translocating ferredoxin:NAD+ oxidoreductase subunit E
MSPATGWKVFSAGFWVENPTLVVMLGFCPTLAVSTSAWNGIGMGLATLAVLLGSNVAISLIRSLVPKKVRIPSYIVVIATFVSLVDMSLEAFVFNLHQSLGIFIPLIVVNCIILGRAEAFASKNTVGRSILDALGMGLGFTLTLFLLGAVREILGNGTLTLFQYQDVQVTFQVLAKGSDTILVMILPPGAFIAIAFFMARMNAVQLRRKTSVGP